MAIKYYPNRLQKGIGSAIDRVRAKRTSKLISGSKDITTEALDEVVKSTDDWQVNNIKLTFSNATPRNYTAKIMGGRNVLEGLNDSLWIQHADTLPQEITLNSGFYDGTDLATELQSQLNANSVFSDLSITFAVAYDDTTGLFTIAPSSGTIRYLNINTMTVPRYQDSIAGHLFGFNSDSSFSNPIESDTAVFGLNQETWIIDETGATITEHFFDDTKTLNIDQALHLTSNVASVRIDYEISCENII